MRDEIRIRLSLGLIAVTIVHAVLLGVVFTALHRVPKTQQCDRDSCFPNFEVPVSPQVRPTGQIERLPEPTRINYEAQGELKQQQNVCYPNRVIVYPSRFSGGIVNVRPASTVQPVRDVSQTTPVASTPAVSTAAEKATSTTASTSPPPKKSYQIALFVGDDSQSRQLMNWFNENPQLIRLREGCEFQIYTAENAIYRSRFQNIVPVAQFPVVLFQDATGGHVHAAGRTMIPASASELYSDLKQGYELYQQAKRAQKTGAVKTDGYSWDDAISPTLYLSAEDCPDGYCPVEPVDTWRPGDRLRDGLFDRDKDDTARNALFWLSAGEIATVALTIVAVILLGFILIKRGM